jgi:hypothetical protein
MHRRTYIEHGRKSERRHVILYNTGAGRERYKDTERETPPDSEKDIGKETISEEQVEREEWRKVNKEGSRRNSEGNTLADVETA